MNDLSETRLTASDVFARSAIELNVCVKIMHDIEAQLLPSVAQAASRGQERAASDALQNIDVLVQILEDISLLMSGLADSDGAEAVLAADVGLSRMRLFDLRQRMAGVAAPDIDPPRHVSFF